MDINVDLIKTNIIKKYFTDKTNENIMEMVEHMTEELAPGINNLTHTPFPIFYLFDPQISHKFGSSFRFN